MEVASTTIDTPPGYTLPRHKLKTKLKDSTKTPLVVVGCGSYSPVTYLHLRMFEMGFDYIGDTDEFEIIGGYFSPVSDAYAKPGLAPCTWIMVDTWEPSQTTYTRTARVLEHFEFELNGKDGDGGFLLEDGTIL
ncbi:hypothetical protein HDV02_002661 [Globomyces sp. JEL0801]|nr:hypothetical protein HDV02_002661 [Globomyces sp. JEL0801]